jgi:hypothetical protein
LQVNKTSDPSQFQDPEKTRSGRVKTLRASPVPTFQMTTMLSDPADKRMF